MQALYYRGPAFLVATFWSVSEYLKIVIKVGWKRGISLSQVSEWNEQLQLCREKLQLKHKWESRLKELNLELESQYRTADECLQRLRKEEGDVHQLTSASFSQFFLKLFGRLDDKLREEEREAAEAKLHYDAAEAAATALERDKAAVIAELAEVNDAEAEYARLLKDKESWITKHDPETTGKLEQLSLQLGSAKAMIREIQEAIHAGSAVKASLEQAEEKLSSAKNWGTYDLLGGGMISTAIKHGRIDEASAHIHDAQHGLRTLEKELRDLNWNTNMTGVDMSGMLKFADYFFDGLIADWIVQGRINSSLESVQTRIHDMNRLIDRLKQERRRMESEIAGVASQRQLLLEQFEA